MALSGTKVPYGTSQNFKRTCSCTQWKSHVGKKKTSLTLKNIIRKKNGAYIIGSQHQHNPFGFFIFGQIINNDSMAAGIKILYSILYMNIMFLFLTPATITFYSCRL